MLAATGRRSPAGARLALPGALALLVALAGLGSPPAAPAAHVAGEHPPMEPSQAYRLDAAATADVLVLDWAIADGYHLFHSKFSFRSRTPEVALGEPRLGPGELITDDFFGEVRVFRGAARVEVPLKFDGPAPGEVVVEATSQGCAVGGDCFPPFTQTVRAAVAAGPPPAASPAPRAAPARDEKVLRALLDLGDLPAGPDEETEFLPPDEAFRLSTEVDDTGTVVARWDIADGYYLYRERFDFQVAEPAEVGIARAELPQGKMKEDEYFGRMEVYYHDVEAVLRLERPGSAASQLALDLGYQGCADAGLCYPPITKRVTLSLPPGASPAAAAAAVPPAGGLEPVIPEADLPEQDRIARSLSGGSTWLVLLTFFGFGLLLTFTPCVFPMIPILSSIIVGQGDDITTRRAFTLSLVYVLAMAATYTAAGVLAGLFGANLQAAFQNPWILGAFSAIFVLLALAMFGFYDLQIPPAWQAKLARLSNRQQRGTYIGVGIMGFLSALIVGPCVAAPLAGALIYIGQTGDAVLGGMALFALSMGMGTPVLLVGSSAGKLLPKAGPWMDTVKAVFGVLLLGVAIYLLERIIPGWVALVLWGALLIVAAIYMGALDALPPGAAGWRRLSKGAGLVMLVYGVLLVVGASSGGNDVFRPLERLASGGAAEKAELRFESVKGPEGLRAALRTAAQQGRPVMLDYYADWCVSCKEMEKYTFSDPGVQAALADTVLLRTDVTANDHDDRALLRAFGLFGPPAILFFGPNGEERRRFRVVGFMDAEQFRAVAQKATAVEARLRTSGIAPRAPSTDG